MQSVPDENHVMGVGAMHGEWINKIGRLTLFLAVAILAGTVVGTSPHAASSPRKLKFIVNFIGGPEIPFFAVVKNGVEQAGKDLGVDAIFQAPKCCDITLQAQLLKAAVASHPDGIAVEFNDPQALSGPILQALDAGIPVDLVNVQNYAANTDRRIKDLAYVGWSEIQASERLAEETLPYIPHGSSGVCVNPAPSQVQQLLRCNTIAKTLSSHGIHVTNLVDTETVPSSGAAVIDAYIRKHPNTGAIFTLNEPTTGYACLWVQKNNKQGSVVVGAFDLGPNTDHCIQLGIVKVALNQQPYAQGYLAVVNLFLTATEGNAMSNINTGTAVVTKSNIEKYIGLVNAGRN